MVKKIFNFFVLLMIISLGVLGTAEAKSNAELENITTYEIDENLHRIEIAYDGQLDTRKVSMKVIGDSVTVDLDETIPGRISRVSGINIDRSGFVKRISTNETGINHTRVRIALSKMVNEKDCSISIQPKDRANKTSARVVIDIDTNKNDSVYMENFDFNDKVVVIDAGHGGSDKGAIGPRGVTEKSVTLAVALKVEKLLVADNFKVVMTRRTDVDVASPNASDVAELQSRVNKCPPQTDIFISIHCNAFTNPNSNGMETYYYNGNPGGRRLAQLLNEELQKYGGRFNRGVKSANFYVLKHNRYPASLIELAFVTNPQEEQLLSDDYYQEDLAKAIVSAVKRYFSGN